jgi:hypothetical protein
MSKFCEQRLLLRFPSFRKSSLVPHEKWSVVWDAGELCCVGKLTKQKSFLHLSKKSQPDCLREYSGQNKHPGLPILNPNFMETKASADRDVDFKTITPSILYFGNPVAIGGARSGHLQLNELAELSGGRNN